MSNNKEELLPVAAQIEQLKKQLAEAEKKNELYEEAAKKAWVEVGIK